MKISWKKKNFQMRLKENFSFSKNGAIFERHLISWKVISLIFPSAIGVNNKILFNEENIIQSRKEEKEGGMMIRDEGRKQREKKRLKRKWTVEGSLILRPKWKCFSQNKNSVDNLIKWMTTWMNRYINNFLSWRESFSWHLSTPTSSGFFAFPLIFS